MASETDISNLALAHLGEAATVAAINPPDGSANADHCARFYPMARDALLELHEWSFCSTRAALSELVTTAGPWRCAYGLPSDMITAIAIEPLADAPGSLLGETLREEQEGDAWPRWSRICSEANFEIETTASGAKVLLANVSPAVLRYTRRVTDPTLFSPLFVRVLSWLLAGELAGPVMKGETGATAAARCNAMAQKLLAEARMSDANGRRVQLHRQAPWISARR